MAVCRSLVHNSILAQERPRPRIFINFLINKENANQQNQAIFQKIIITAQEHVINKFNT